MITPAPILILVIFSIAFIFSIFWIINLSIKGLKVRHDYGYSILYRRIFIRISIFYLGLLLLVSYFTYNGFFYFNTLPPRIIVFVSLPLTLGYLFVFRIFKIYRKIIESVSVIDLVKIHAFRFIGVFFLLFSYFGVLPLNFAYPAGIGDILVASLVFPIIWGLKRKLKISRSLLFFWNLLGLIDIILVLVSAIRITSESIELGEQGVLNLTTFPISWIPAIAPATIIYSHFLIFYRMFRRDFN